LFWSCSCLSHGRHRVAVLLGEETRPRASSGNSGHQRSSTSRKETAVVSHISRKTSEIWGTRGLWQGRIQSWVISDVQKPDVLRIASVSERDWLVDSEKAIVGLRPSFSAHVRWGERGAPVRFPVGPSDPSVRSDTSMTEACRDGNRSLARGSRPGGRFLLVAILSVRCRLSGLRPGCGLCLPSGWLRLR
jgi:hypothetical protein